MDVPQVFHQEKGFPGAQSQAGRLRIAVLADIHGNCLALDAVLADIAGRGGADAYWILGDLVALGPQPVAVLERLQGLASPLFVRGNTDRYVTTGDRPRPDRHEVEADLTLLPVYAEIGASFGWTCGALAVSGWLPFLEALPLEQRVALPDGTRVLAVHAAPGSDDAPGVRPDMEPEAWRPLFAGCHADLVVVGHTHWPLDRRVGRVRVVNPGSVSNPVIPGLWASYAMLDATTSGHQIRHHRVAYDREAVLRLLVDRRHPARGFISRYFRGEFIQTGWGRPAVYGPG